MGALRELYERHGAWLHARLIRRCNDPEVVVEVVRTPSSRSGRTRGDSAATARSRAGCGASRSGGWCRGCAPARTSCSCRTGMSQRGRSTCFRRPRTRCSSESSTATSPGAAAPVARVPFGRAGRRARRSDHQGGGTPARRPREHREDPASPCQGAAADRARRAAGGDGDDHRDQVARRPGAAVELRRRRARRGHRRLGRTARRPLCRVPPDDP